MNDFCIKETNCEFLLFQIIEISKYSHNLPIFIQKELNIHIKFICCNIFWRAMKKQSKLIVSLSINKNTFKKKNSFQKYFLRQDG